MIDDGQQRLLARGWRAAEIWVEAEINPAGQRQPDRERDDQNARDGR